MRRMAWLLPAVALAACGDNGNTTGGTWGGGVTSHTSSSSSSGMGGGTTSSSTGGSTASSSGTMASSSGSTTTSSSGTTTSSSSSSSGSTGGCGSGCPTGYTCGTANGLQVCRSPSGIPLFSNVFVILMENTSLSTLSSAMSGGTAPNLKAMAAKFATGSNYHGVAHPSLPNYIALISGGTQSVECDCKASPTLASGGTSCFIGGLHNNLVCNLLLGACSCDQPSTVATIADQLEAAGKSWMAFGEDMGTPCNVTDSGNYAVRHVPFLYFDAVQTNASRCNAHVVDFSGFDPSSPAAFNFIAPNLVDDMHNPDPTTSVNIPDGDKWIGPEVDKIVASSAYQKGGLLVVVWDEDDGSGGITGTDDPIEIFVMSPYAKSGGYVSSVKADHYSLLATFEDGLGLQRLGMAGGATPLGDYFPAN